MHAAQEINSSINGGSSRTMQTMFSFASRPAAHSVIAATVDRRAFCMAKHRQGNRWLKKSHHGFFPWTEMTVLLSLPF
jgi:hypothetical protein